MGFEPKPPAPIGSRHRVTTTEELQGCGALLTGIGIFVLGVALGLAVLIDVTGWCS